MSGYQPKVGDRVRVVLEGEVGHVGDRYLDIGACTLDLADQSIVVSVEKIAPPLPTTPGSVIQQPHYSDLNKFWRYVRVVDGRWLSLDSGAYYPSSEFDRDRLGGIAVIFDAGEVTP